MVATNPGSTIDAVFRALADPTRRRVVERLVHRPASVSELAEPFDMALPSFLQHLRVLEGCGLVDSQKTGRIRTYRLQEQTMRSAERWLSEQRSLWEQRLDQFDAFITQLHKDQP